jgi:anaerobic magnesium-protoporphyrin IX monomethyl ester cyclase
MSRITLINVPCHDREVMTVFPPVGILSMSACLKQAGHDVRFIDADINRVSTEELMALLKAEPSDLIGISMNVSQVKHSVPYIDAIQTDFPETPLILGGPYVSGVREAIFHDFPHVKFAVLNEGEEAICDFVDYLNGDLQLNEVRNLIHQQDGRVSMNQMSRIKDIDALPMPDYSLVAPCIEKYRAVPPTMATPSIAIMCTRGCPYKCTFCSSPVTWNRKVTFRSTDSVIREILFLRALIGVKEVYFQDDTLNARPAWLNELCDKIFEHGLHKEIYFKCALRVNKNLISKELLDKLREANFWLVLYGVENGNQQMLYDMNKNITLDEIKRAFRLTRNAGLSTIAAFMVGNYGETKETVRDSIRLMKQIKPDYIGFSIAAPFPGSELYRIAVEKNLMTVTDFKQYQFGDAILRTEELSTDDMVRYAGEAASEYFKMKVSWKYKYLTRNNLFNKMIGEGFHWPEYWHTWVRRTMKEVDYILRVANGSAVNRICMKIVADYPDIAETPVKMKIRVNGSRHSVVLRDGDWKEISFPINGGAEPNVRIKWKVDRTWNPADYGNPDDRELGVTVEKIWLE